MSSIEDLPIEIWISIFSYLEAHDLFRAFSKLNSYLIQLLRCNQLLYPIQFNQTNHSVSLPILHSDSQALLNRVQSLQWIAQPRFSYLPRFLYQHLTESNQLRSLKIEIYPRQTPLICRILPACPLLEHLSIKSEEIQSSLIETIFSLPSLRLCELNSSSHISDASCRLNEQSHMEVLCLTNIWIAVNSSQNTVYDYLPKLDKLQIICSLPNFKRIFSRFTKEISNLQTIPKTKIKCQSNRIISTFMEQLPTFLSVINSISLNLYLDLGNEFLLQYLIELWWPSIQSIEKVTVTLRIASADMQTNLTSDQKKFLADVNLLNEQHQVHLVQTECPFYRLNAEISTAV